MISTHHLIRRLTKERTRLRWIETETDFVRGLEQGLTLAVAFVRELQEETRHQKVSNPTGKTRKTV